VALPKAHNIFFLSTMAMTVAAEVSNDIYRGSGKIMSLLLALIVPVPVQVETRKSCISPIKCYLRGKTMN